MAIVPAVRRLFPVLTLALGAGLWQHLLPQVLKIYNPCGSITARVARSEGIRVERVGEGRALNPGDVSITRENEQISVECRATDGARIDLEVTLPYGAEIRAKTTSQPISLSGLVRRADLETDSGDLDLSVPLPATRLYITAKQKPAKLVVPAEVKFRQEETRSAEAEPGTWRLTDRMDDDRVTFGTVQATADAPGRVEIKDLPIPEDSPVKLPWQAPGILERMLEAGAAPKPRAQTAPPIASSDSAPAPAAEETALFRSDVRLVNLTVAAYDVNGRPVTGLKLEDFEVIEDRAPQTVTFAGAEEVPFNLAFLLDLSGSTRRDRAAMQVAVRRFLEVTRPNDRVALYALASNIFFEVAPLTGDRRSIARALELIPGVSGGTPLYDALVLGYAQEFEARPGERNALIVISDGVDNRLYGVTMPSEVSFRELRRAAGLMQVLLYPVFLDPFTVAPAPGWARQAKKNMEQLAQVTGGRLFTAKSIQDLEPVYGEVANELRSVYTLAYYPSNQVFDGRWRQLAVRVKRAGVTVRTRPGYFAR